MIAERIRSEWNAQQLCAFATKWRIDWNLALALQRMTCMLEQELRGIAIISGWRSCAEQRRLEQEGRPAASCETSTHTSAVATGADLQLLIAKTNVTKARLGYYVAMAGLRWGGGGPVDPQTGIPLDWNHVDLGPRQYT